MSQLEGDGGSNSVESVSGEKIELVSKFVEVTNAHADVARQLLESCNWDLQYAVALYLVGRENEEENQSRSLENHSREASPAVAEYLRQSRPVGGESTIHNASDDISDNSLQWLLSQLSRSWFGSVWRFLWSMSSTLHQLLMSLVSHILRLTALFLFGPREDWPSVGTNNSSVPGRFETYFNRKYTEVHPNFFRGTFEQAIRACREGNKLLFVYLHNDSVRDTHFFCTKVFTEDVVVEMLNCVDNFIVWCEDIGKREGHQVSVTVRARRYPHVSVLLPTFSSTSQSATPLISSTPASSNNFKRLVVLEPVTSVDAVVQSLTQCIDKMDHHRELISQRQRQNHSDRLLREEQDQEYELAKLKDAQREVERKKESEAQQAEEKQKKELIERKKARVEKKKKASEAAHRKREILSKKFQEEDELRQVQPMDHNDIVRVRRVQFMYNS
eukprot:GHVQ01016840.1.p1 GENE.GHVQ01016840.1~~GHVQ01016840.1.p1  ORF type:complete len:444 (+),score=58.28 GHVQ01016840.1:178-1509(+)